MFNSVTMLLLKYQYKITGHTVAQLVNALRYIPEVRGFDFRCSH